MKKMGRSFGHAWRGIRQGVRLERQLKIHLAAAGLVAAAAWKIGVTAMEGAILALTVGLVIMAELFNTALERLLDHLSPEHHPAVGLVKDIAAGAVLVTALAAVVVAWFILGRKVCG